MTERQLSEVDAPGIMLSATTLHDMRTPLNHIIGYSEMLTERAREQGNTDFVPDLQRIGAAGHQLLTMLSSGTAPDPDAMTRNGGSISAGPPDRWNTDSSTAASIDPSEPLQSPALILVVDDNEMNRDVLSRRLERQGYAVAMAENGRQAMDAVRRRAFDLVLLDVMMPDMDGYEVLQELKADETLRHIPVIMISAVDELDSLVRCIKMGAEDYLPKPFDPTLLKARIGACLAKKRAHDSEVRLFKQLQQNYTRLQELEQLRDDLTHMIVHDLRTPLTSLISGIQTLAVVGDLDEIQREMVAIATEGGESLLGMINDLLDVEKMESGAMQLEYAVLDAADLVAGAADQVASLFASENLSLVTRIAADVPSFQGDETKLRRILVNLLGNAIKFTPAGGAVKVDVRLDVIGGSLLFSVSDTGEGIPAEAFERIFEKFGQVESRHGGRRLSTGLGLAYCKLAVAAHGGDIRVESVPHEGSTFSFTIPLAPHTDVSSLVADAMVAR